MQNNKHHIGSNWTGRTYRTLDEAGIRGVWSEQRAQIHSKTFKYDVVAVCAAVCAFLLWLFV